MSNYFLDTQYELTDRLFASIQGAGLILALVTSIARPLMMPNYTSSAATDLIPN